MAPEQIRCRQIDPRTDVYSLGVIMFHMVAGRPPFVGANSVEILEQHLRDPVPVISEVVRDVEYAPELEVIIQRCMEKDPADRYQSMDELISDLKAAHRLITGVSVHTDASMPVPVLSDISGSMVRPPDLSMPPTARPGRDDDKTPVPAKTKAAAFVATAPDLASHDSFDIDVTGQGRPVARYVAVAAALLFVLVGAFALVRMLASDPPKKVEPIAAKEPVPLVPEATPELVAVRLTTVPAGATVRLDGRVLGVTPLTTKLPADVLGTKKSFAIDLEGYETSSIEADVREPNVELHAALTPVRRPPVQGVASVEEAFEEPSRDAPRRARRRRARRARSEPERPSSEKTAPPQTEVAEGAAKPATPSLQVERAPRSALVEEGGSLVVDDEDRGAVVDEGGVPIVD
jgi:serine/threonine-protein kinase